MELYLISTAVCVPLIVGFLLLTNRIAETRYWASPYKVILVMALFGCIPVAQFAFVIIAFIIFFCCACESNSGPLSKAPFYRGEQ